MPHRELNFDRHNIFFAVSELKDMFPVPSEQRCRYVAMSA